MPRFEPFRAIRYAPAIDLDAVVAPPYDVLSDADVDALAARDAAQHRPRRRPPRRPTTATSSAGAAAADVARRRASSSRDEEPTFTLYRMRFTDAAGAARDLVGVLGGLEVVDEGAGGVLPHERTTPKASTDRLDLTRATDANLSPVWGLSLATGLTDLLAEPGEPVGAVTVDGVEHVVERVTDPARIAAIREHLGRRRRAHRRRPPPLRRQPHSTATRSGRRPAATDTPAEQTLAFVGELVAEQLSIEAIHRLYTGDRRSPTLRAALGRALRPRAGAARRRRRRWPTMVAEGRLVLVGPDGRPSG